MADDGILTIEDKVAAAGGVLAPELITEAFADQLPAGVVAVTVLSVTDENPELASKYSDNWMVECQYPDGFITSHQIPKTSDGSDLITMIQNKVRARNGLPSGAPPVAGVVGLNPVAGDLIGTMPPLVLLAGQTLTFTRIG